jgi:hypothetical protein
MIRLKKLILEMQERDVQQLLNKIKQKQFAFFNRGDNGRIYKFNDEDYLFKITTEREEYRVAEIIVGRYQQFSTFIPVHYVDGKNMYIMSMADPLPGSYKSVIDSFIKQYQEYASNEGGEVSIFDFLDADGARNTDIQLVNFLRALQQDVQKTGIDDLDLDLDFRTSNVMLWNGNMVMIDW